MAMGLLFFNSYMMCNFRRVALSVYTYIPTSGPDDNECGLIAVHLIEESGDAGAMLRCGEEETWLKQGPARWQPPIDVLPL